MIELDVGEAKLRFKDCYVKVIPAMSDRPAVLQITSYADPSTESFPSVFIRSVVPADDIKAFLGQPLSAKIYMTRQDKGTVWHTPDDAPANIVVQTADDSGRVVGSIISAVVLNSDSPEELTITGRFDGTLQ
jgi:multidrug efflux pump subunit AcrA (membrane-fusion protein)